MSRGRGSSTWTTSGRFSVNSKNSPPFEAKRRPTKRPPTPTDLGRISDETARLHMNQYVSRTLQECQTRLPDESVRLTIQSHSARWVSSGFVSVISLRNYLVNLGELNAAYSFS